MAGRAVEQGLTLVVAREDATSNSDHYCFADQGVPALLVTTLGGHTVYHTPEDTIETIDVEDLEAATLLMWAVLEPLSLGLEEDYTAE